MKHYDLSLKKGSERQISRLHIALLTGGGDKPYAIALASALTSRGIFLDFIGSDEVNGNDIPNSKLIRFLNLRGNQNHDAFILRKVVRVVIFYFRLIRYVPVSQPKIFHVLWNNKLDYFDRIVLMLYYKLLGKTIVLTVHNVNRGQRDRCDNIFNRLSLKFQYRLVDQIFVHTKKMRQELEEGYCVDPNKVSVIPFGINDTLPVGRVSSVEAKKRLNIALNDKVILFFGNIAPYKGLEYLLDAFVELMKKHADYRLLIAGNFKATDVYRKRIEQQIIGSKWRGRIIAKLHYIPDEEVETYFKAADVLVLPYVHIYQSGVLFLSYNYGLPTIAADVGSLREDVIEGITGMIFRPRDHMDLAHAIEKYFASELFLNLEHTRGVIRNMVARNHSWDVIAERTEKVYMGMSDA
jgi:D-inositol-3-phosphate glycosyltransferase